MRRLSALAFALALSLPLAAQTITPDQLWNALLQSNKRFVAGSLTFEKLQEQRTRLAKAQTPPMTVLSCSDSRIPPELIFNQDLGVLFVVRASGNIADDFGVASIEYAILQGWTRLIVVLGHENCGAITAALGGAEPNTPALSALAKRLRSSFAGVPYDSRDAANVTRAAQANTRASAAHLLAHSQLIRDAVLTQKIAIVPAYYDVGTGEVKKLE